MLEAEVVLAGIVGDDAEARILQRLMDDLSVETSAVFTDPERRTTTKPRFVGRAAQHQPHQILRVDRESRTPLSSDLEQRLTDVILGALPSCHAVLISDYGKGVCTPALLRRVIEAARQHGIPILIDPSRGVDYQRYARATLITPNRIAAEQAHAGQASQPVTPPTTPPVSPGEPGGVSPRTLPASTPPETRPGAHAARLTSSEILEAASQLCERLQRHAVINTLDRDGLAYATSTETGLIPCRPRDVSDVTGAGDMVLAMLGLCLAAKVPLVDSLYLANAAAGLEVERFGVEPVTRAEILAELSGRNTPLVKQVAGQRERYRRISEHLEAASLECAVDFQYQEMGIRIRGEWFPILKMDWVDGLTLAEFVDQNIEDYRYLGRLVLHLAVVGSVSARNADGSRRSAARQRHACAGTDAGQALAQNHRLRRTLDTGPGGDAVGRGGACGLPASRPTAAADLLARDRPLPASGDCPGNALHFATESGGPVAALPER